MTISSTTNRNDYIGNNTTDTYNYSFKIFTKNDLLVTQKDTNDVETTLTVDTDYTVTGLGELSGGTIVLTAGNLATGYTLTIRRVLTLTQSTDIRSQGDFYPEAHENQFDKLIMIDQQQQDELDRTLKVTESYPDVNTSLTPLASNFLAWNEDASGLTNVAALDGSSNSATATGSTTSRLLANRFADVTNVKDFGAVGDGVTNDTAAVAAAYTYAKSTGGALFFPAGTYLGQYTFDGEAPVYGAGIRRTVLKPSDTSSYCVELYGSGGDSDLGAYISNLSIESTGKVGTGLQLGRLTLDSGLSNAKIDKLEIKGFQYNIRLQRAILCSFYDIISRDGEYGIWGDSEKNVTTLYFNTVRCFTNTYGCYIQTGVALTFVNCNFESSIYKNLWLKSSITQGPSRVIFDGCWLEDITASSGTRYGLHLDQQDNTKQAAILFNRCVISAPAGIPDIHADAANDVVFDSCAFSASSFTTTKLTYSSLTNNVKIRLINCGTIQDAPTEAMYSSFPALTRVSGGTFGYFYEFNTLGGKYVNNFKTLSVNSDQTSLQTAYLDTLIVDTSGGTININSFAGGSDGQRLKIIKPSSSNNISLKHNGTGTEKMYLKDGADVSLTARRGADLVCYSGVWYESSTA